MPTEKPIITLAVDDALLKRIEDFQAMKRIFNRSQAVRQLVEAGLAHFGEGKTPDDDTFLKTT
jgi:metal-responsive CopG/Arc/MetJ family transcriptional regulator